MKHLLRLGFLSFFFIILSFFFVNSGYAQERNNDPAFEFITGIDLEDENGDPLDGADYPKNQAVKLTYYFQVPGGTVDIEDVPVDVADHFTLEVPSEVAVPSISGMEIRTQETGDLVATLDSVPASNQLVVTFTEDAYTESGIIGNFWFVSSFDEDNVGMTEPVEIYFDVGQAIPDDDVLYQIDFEQPDLESSKHSSSYDPVTKQITWQIDVNTTDLVIDDFGIIDSLPDEIDFVDGTFEVDDGAYVVNSSDYSYDDSVSPKILTYNFPNQVTQEHKITYKTTVSDAALNSAQGNVLVVSNDADMTVNGFPMEMDKTPASIPIEVIEKSVANGSSSRETDWTINVNESLLNIAGASVTDTLPQYVSVVTDSIKIDGVQIFAGTNVDEYVVAGIPSTGQTLTVNLGDITGAKEITYTTSMTDELYYTQDNEALSNNAVLSPNPTYPNHQASASITPATEVIRKTGPAYDRATGRLSWVIYVNSHDMGLTNVVVTDTIPTDQTFEESTFYVTYGDGTTPFDAANSGLNYVNGNDFFTYTFPASITEEYIIRYETQVVDSDIFQGNHPNVTYTNSATMSYDEGDDAVTNSSQTVTSEVIEKNDDGYDYTSRRMSWVIQVNENQNELTGVKVTDTMSTDQDFVTGSFHIYRGDGTGGTEVTGDAGVGTFTHDDINDAFEYSFAGLINEIYTITFESEFIDLSQLEQNATISIQNEAVIEHDGISPPDTSLTSGNIVSEVISKSDNYVDGQSYVDWNIVVNRNKIMLEDVKVIDEFPQGLELDTTSIELYNLDVLADNNVSETTLVPLTADDLDYDLDTRTLTVTFPSPITTAYMLKFRSYVVDSGQDPFNNYVKINSGTLNTEIGYSNQVDTSFAQYGGSATGEMGSITITKQDIEDNTIKLQGAVFELYDLYDIPVREITTNSSGEAFFDRIVFGKQYSIREKTPPTGYNANPYVHYFTITDQGDDNELERLTYTYNDQIIKGDLTFTKEGEVKGSATNSPLQAATFTIFETDGTSTGMTAVSASDGTVTFADIPYGDYYVQETDAPEGYDINNTHYNFSIRNEGEVVTLTPESVVNMLSRGDITFTKVDENAAPLQGAVFGLYDSTDTLLETATSGADGVVAFSDRLAGDYEIREESVPDGYIAASNLLATINIDGDDVDLGNVQNDYIEVILNKVTQGTNNLIASTAEFRLYSGTNPTGAELEDLIMQSGNIYFWNGSSFDVTAGTAGRITVESLDDGDYYFEEITAPEKYDLPTGGDEITAFTVSDSNQTLTVENELSESTLTLTKTDGTEEITNNPAEFRMYNSAHLPIIMSGSSGSYTYSGIGDSTDTATLLETDNTGTLTIFRLIYDDYYFIETSAPYGFEEDNTTNHDITVDTDIESLIVTNDALPTYGVTLTKTNGTNAITNNQAGFRFYTSADEPVLVTGSSGSYTFNRVGIGTETATEIITSATGSLSISDVPTGNYYFLETQAPVDYSLDSTTRHSVSVNGSDETLSVSNALAPIYSLGDYVWIDADKDGVQDNGEIPVDNVTVKLYDEQGNQVGDSVITGSGTWTNGYYNFSGLTAGSYYVVFSDLPENYIFTSADSGGDDTQDSDANVATGVTQAVLINNSTTTDNHYPDLDCGIQLNVFSLGDYVWIDADRDGVQDSDEAAVNNITVKLFDSSGTQVGNSVLTGSDTWDDGYYEFTNLLVGDYYVEFSNLPTAYTFTYQNIGDDETYDSDADVNTGRTDVITLNASTVNQNGHYTNLDAGICLVDETTQVDIHVESAVNDGSPTDNEQFAFTIIKTDEEGNEITGPDAYSETVFNDNGDIDFPIQYDDSDVGQTYYYRITQDDTTLYGYSADTSAIDVRVEVYESGKNIVATVSQFVEGNELTSDYTFSSDFKQLTQEEMEEEGVDPIFTVVKTIDGQPVSQGETFSFAVQQVDADGNPISGGLSEVAESDVSGYAEFSQLLYYAQDIGEVYYYEVTEVEGTGDFIYDTSKYTATIEITNEDPSTPVVVTVVMRDEDGTEQSTTIIEDQGLEVRVPSVTFDNKTSGINDTDDESNDLPNTATDDYLWLFISAMIVVLLSVCIIAIMNQYKKQLQI